MASWVEDIEDWKGYKREAKRVAAGIANEITGTVTKVNGTGFKIAEREDWINVSRYAVDGEAPMPALGQHVKIGLDKSGYARKITMLDHSAPVAPQDLTPAPAVSPFCAIDKDTLIVRQSSIKAAVDMLGHNQRDYGLDELFSTAASIEAWVNRGA